MELAFINKVRSALKHDCPYFDLRQRDLLLQNKNYTQAAVLLLFGFYKTKSQPTLLLTKRTFEVETHKGQIAFPGGILENESSLEAALRETQEEVGIDHHKIEVLGALPVLPTLTTQFLITPFIGILKTTIEEIQLKTNPSEIQNAFWIEWDAFNDPKNIIFESHSVQNWQFIAPVFKIDQHKIWGATAIMIQNLAERMYLLED